MSFTNESLAMAEEEINFTGGDDLSRDEESTGGGSFVSGVVADGNIVTFRDLVDLTAPTSCRVIMTQRGPRRVCGNRFGACSRNSHNDIAARDAHRRAPASFYLAYQTRQGGLDGLFDSSYSAEDAIRMRDSEVEEQVARLRELEGSAGSSPVVVETVNSEEVLEDSDLQGDSYSPPPTPLLGLPTGEETTAQVCLRKEVTPLLPTNEVLDRVGARDRAPLRPRLHPLDLQPRSLDHQPCLRSTD